MTALGRQEDWEEPRGRSTGAPRADQVAVCDHSRNGVPPEVARLSSGGSSRHALRARRRGAGEVGGMRDEVADEPACRDRRDAEQSEQRCELGGLMVALRRSMSLAEGMFSAVNATSRARTAFSRASNARVSARVTSGFSRAPWRAARAHPHWRHARAGPRRRARRRRRPKTLAQQLRRVTAGYVGLPRTDRLVRRPGDFFAPTHGLRGRTRPR
jgi:hypothetical protein